MIDRPTEFLTGPKAKYIDRYAKEPRSFKAYQQIVQAKLDMLDINLKLVEHKMTGMLYESDHYRRLAIEHHQLLECQDEWLNLSYSDYLRLLGSNDTKDLGWKIPGA